MRTNTTSSTSVTDLFDALSEDFICPITQEVMKDPVIAADDHTYDRASMEQWIATRGGRAISPMTGQRLVHLQCHPNITLKKVNDAMLCV